MKPNAVNLKKYMQPPEQFRGIIKKLAKDNTGQLTKAEYSYIANHILIHKPCNLLIFGLGRDSELWLKCNKNGNTVFIEHEREWIKQAKKKLSNIKIIKVKYNTKRKNWKSLINQPKKLQLKLPSFIRDTVWDIIFVDSPQGYNINQPGRMKSIFAASRLRHHHIFLHDADREVEKEFGKKFCGKLVIEKDRLHHYMAK